jgi:hypothetical protein
MERTANQREPISVLAVFWRKENCGCQKRPPILSLDFANSEVDRAFQ